MNRRDFLKVTGVTAAAIALPGVIDGREVDAAASTVLSTTRGEYATTRGGYVLYYQIGKDWPCRTWYDLQRRYVTAPNLRNNVAHNRSIIVDVEPDHLECFRVFGWTCSPGHYLHIVRCGKIIVRVGEGIEICDPSAVVECCTVYNCTLGIRGCGGRARFNTVVAAGSHRNPRHGMDNDYNAYLGSEKFCKEHILGKS